MTTKKLKPFYVKIESTDQAGEVIDIAVKLGAVAYEGVSGYHERADFISIYTPDGFEYVGVKEDGSTFLGCGEYEFGKDAELLTLGDLQTMLLEKEGVFTKDMLKDGEHIVTTRNEGEFLVLVGGLLYKPLTIYNSWMDLEKYSQEMRLGSDSSYDIMKVERFHKSDGKFNFDKERACTFRTTVWERKPPEPEIEELTLEQVCKELNREIKIVKG